MKDCKPDQQIRARGTDIKTGEVVLEKNTVLRAAEIGLLATVGVIEKIKIYKKPRIGLVSTGNELVHASTVNLPDGKIRDSNKLMLTAFFTEN